MTVDKARWEFGENFAATLAEHLEKNGGQFLSEVRAKHPATYRSLVKTLFGDAEHKDELTDSVIFDEMLKGVKRYRNLCTQKVKRAKLNPGA